MPETKLTIDAQPYFVRVTDKPLGGDAGSRFILGGTSEEANVIVVDGTLPKARQEEVLFHELCHVADPEAPEFAISTMSRRLYGILFNAGLLVPDMVGKMSTGGPTKEELAIMEKMNDRERMMSEGPTMKGRLAGVWAKVSEKPWSGFSESDFTPEEWRRSCLIHMDGDPDVKANHKLPVKEPNGDINRNAVHAAAAALAGARGGVDAPMSKKKMAAKRIVGMYKSDLDEEPPESMMEMAGMD